MLFSKFTIVKIQKKNREGNFEFVCFFVLKITREKEYRGKRKGIQVDYGLFVTRKN